MFQFRRFPTYAYFVQRTLTEYCSAGFPHSEIPGSKLMCSSPRLIAACHVLHRLSMPRHSPCALISLTSSKQSPFRSEHPLGYSSLHFLASPLPREPACAGLRSELDDFFLVQDQIEMLGRLPKHFNLFLVEVTGLEPVTPCLQSKCSTS